MHQLDALTILLVGMIVMVQTITVPGTLKETIVFCMVTVTKILVPLQM
jgi:hypothetical protein